MEWRNVSTIPYAAEFIQQQWEKARKVELNGESRGVAVETEDRFSFHCETSVIERYGTAYDAIQIEDWHSPHGVVIDPLATGQDTHLDVFVKFETFIHNRDVGSCQDMVRGEAKQFFRITTDRTVPSSGQPTEPIPQIVVETRGSALSTEDWKRYEVRVGDFLPDHPGNEIAVKFPWEEGFEIYAYSKSSIEANSWMTALAHLKKYALSQNWH